MQLEPKAPGGIESSEVFETVTVSRQEFLHSPTTLIEQLGSMVEASEIRIVDIKRQRDQLTITFRRLR